MSVSGDHRYSTLEAVPSQRVQQQCQPQNSQASDPGKQVVPENGKQCVAASGIEVSEKDGLFEQVFCCHHVLSRRRWKTKCIISGGAIGLMVILAAVLGGVLGSRHNSSATASRHSPPESSATSTSATSPSATSSTTPARRNIAAVSFAWNTVNSTRVYFQDDVGQIMESANSADSPTWSTKAIGVDTSGKNGSAIAAAVSRPGYALEISVFYLDPNNAIHDITWTHETGNWSSGTLASQNYTAMPNSSLSAMYNQCPLCANTTIIAFQDESGSVQVGNLTADGWTLTQLGQALDPTMGTGLALQPFYRNGSEDQINLYHQKSNFNMGLASWKPASVNNGVDGWSLDEQVYNTVPSGSPIAAASSYSNVSTGFETWIEVLALSDTGIQVMTWSGALNNWLNQYTYLSATANSTTNERIYGGMAVTAIGEAFAVVTQNGSADEIDNWQVADDTVEWTLIGSVDLGGAWE